MNEYERLRRQAIVLRDMYPPGTRVECLCMNDPFAPVPSGTKGTVFHVDDMAQIHVNWDNGSSLALNRDIQFPFIRTAKDIWTQLQTEFYYKITPEFIRKLGDDYLFDLSENSLHI